MAVDRTPPTDQPRPCRPAPTLASAERPDHHPRPARATTRCCSPFGMEEHPQGGFHGLLEVIPTKADYILDLIRANSLWPLLSGLSAAAPSR